MAGRERLSWISQNFSVDLLGIRKYFTINIKNFFFSAVLYAIKTTCFVLIRQTFSKQSLIYYLDIFFPSANPPFPSSDFTSPNVWPHDGDIFVPVIAGLLMHEAQGMHEFVGDYSNSEAFGGLERHSLSSTASAEVGPAPGLLMIKGLSV